MKQNILGYKEKINEIKNTYPNIRILYTGLDWNTVIANETTLAHGRNLISKNSGNDWLCQECKNNGRIYDSGLSCASVEAVKYMMDPRNHINSIDIFQFQELNTAVGNNVNEVSTVLQYQKAKYLANDIDAIQAFANVSSNKGLNAYHLITRVIQEQGRNGTTPLSSGMGYTGNGYQNYGYGYYNLFSIDATRTSRDPIYKIYLNALDRAATEGWTSRSASIIGGGNFVGDSYINVGQNTLYLQKFDVYNTSGQLYCHQYMQNLYGAKNEAKILYNCYVATGIQYNKEFRFLIPVYENMPAKACQEPGTQYVGYMTSYMFDKMKIVNNKITGNLVVQEWINNVTQEQPKKMPKVYLVDSNNKKVECSVSYLEPYLYNFVVDMNNITTLQDYYIEVQCADSNNISNHVIVKINFDSNYSIGTLYSYNVYIENSLLKFSYDGYMTSSPYGNISVNNNILSGNLIVQEWINGVTQVEPKINPIVVLKADDGTTVNCYVQYIEPYIYKYSVDLNNIDKNKKYKIEVQCGTIKNISTHTKVEIKYPDGQIGNSGYNIVIAENGKIKFVVNGYMNVITSGEIVLNGNIVTGRLIIQEWMNGITQVEPITMPKIVLKGANGNQIVGIIRKIEPYVYEYSLDLSSANKETKYEMEVQCTNENNISIHKNVVVNYSDKKIGKIGNYTLKYQNQKLLFEKVSLQYEGYINIITFGEMSLSGNTISGRLVIQEWIDGITQVEPTSMPKIVLKATTGNQIEGTIRKIEPYVYEYRFDLSSVNKDTSYEMEVQSTNVNNISTHKNVVVNYRDKTIGKIGDYTLKYQNQKLVFSLTYNGYMTNAPYGEISLSGNTITGRLIIQEWRNGTKQVEPTTMPKIVLKGANGTQTVGTIRKIEPYVYEYTFNISGINREITYEMEVQSTDVNNISTHKDVVVNYSNRTIGKIGDYTLKYQNQKLIFEKINLQYEGYMNIITSGEINLSGNTISGRLVIQEWINGTKQVEPTSMPKIVLKDVNGTQIVGTIRKIEPYVYEYTFNISGINKETTYEMEVQSTDVNNISSHKNGVVNYNDKILGKVENYTLKYQNQKLIFENV